MLDRLLGPSGGIMGRMDGEELNKNLMSHANKMNYHFLKKLPFSDQQIIRCTSAMNKE